MDSEGALVTQIKWTRDEMETMTNGKQKLRL